MMRGMLVTPPAGAPIGTLLKDWASTDTFATAAGVTTGAAIGEWIGTALSEYLKLEAGWADVAGKAVGKGILSFVLFVIARRTGGMTRVFLNGAAIGPLVSVLLDVIAQFTAPGFGFGASTSSAKGITMKVNKNAPSVGATSKVITSI